MGSLLETEAHLQLDGLKVLSSKAKVSLTIKPLLLLLAHDAALHSLTPREVIEGLSSSHYIVERAPGCLLSFHISFRSLTYASPTEELCHKLASSIIEAPWWAQLPLTASLKDDDSTFAFNHSASSFTLLLKNSLPTLSSGNSGSSLSPCPRDVQVPHSLRTLKLQEIRLELEFVGQRAEYLANRHESFPNGHFDEDLLYKDDGNKLTGAVATNEVLAHRSSVEDDMILDDVDYQIDTASQEAPSLAWDCSQPASQDCVLTCSNIELETDNIPPVTTKLLDFTTAICLTDLALRTVIGGSQMRKTLGIIACKPLPEHHLARLMPILFSPGFSSNLSQQSANVTTISQAMASISPTSQSPTLKAKLTALKLKNGNNSIFDTVKTSSLRTMHKTLYNRNSCRRLLQTCQKIEIDIEREDSSTLIDEDAKVEPTEVAVLSQHTGLRREQSLEQGLEEILDSELMSDDDIDLLLDLEMMRRESGKKADESCSILLGDKSDAQSRASKPEDHDLEMLDGGEAVSITDKDSIILKGDDEDRDMEESSMLSVDSGDRMLC